jgi:hypothetical protein
MNTDPERGAEAGAHAPVDALLPTTKRCPCRSAGWMYSNIDGPQGPVLMRRCPRCHRAESRMAGTDWQVAAEGRLVWRPGDATITNPEEGTT